MNIDPTLSLPRTLQMHAGSEVMLSTRCMGSAGMPIEVGSAVNLDVMLLRPAQVNSPGQSLVVGGFPLVLLRLQAKEVGSGDVEITWSRPWEGSASTSGFSHRIQVSVHPVGTDLPEMAHQIADQISVAPPASKQEVAAFLDQMDGRRPYGARKVAAAQMVLDQVASSLAMEQALACTRDLPPPPVSDLVSDGALMLLEEMGFSRFALPGALATFIKGR